jgi:predicted Zn-dependent protease
MRRRSFMALSGASLVCGCSGAVHQLPPISRNNLGAAQTEVRGAGGPPLRRFVTDEEMLEALRSALGRIRAPASQVCGEMNVGVCDWTFRAVRDSSLNAGSEPNGLITVNRGVVEYAANEEQICMVIAHEMGHEAANHLAASRRNQTIGAVVGAVLLGAAGVALSGGRYGTTNAIRSAMNAGANIGGAIGGISFSKEQEREADYLAALILYRAGVDLDKARGLLVTMARASSQRETGILDTHPAGPERIAGWDRAVAEIRASNGRLPRRAS